MTRNIANGVWPTMLTPFTKSREVDYEALGALTEWYIDQGVQGLFAVCQSSEMFALSLEERVEIARFVKQAAGGRVPVIASGHVSDPLEDQIEEVRRIAGTGVDAVVLVTNRLAGEDEDDHIWIAHAERILEAVPDVSFGLYECPYPFKRLMRPETLQWCARTGRFLFLKDTCCDLGQIQEKLDALSGYGLKLFNANSATLLESLKIGAAGFSGVMANFHPDLYVWLTMHWNREPDKAEKLQQLLTVASLIELQRYPVNAKYHLQTMGLPMEIISRVRDERTFGANHRIEVEHLDELAGMVRQLLGIDAS